MPSQDSEQAKGRGDGAHSMARTCLSARNELGIHPSTVSDISEVIWSISADSLRRCQTWQRCSEQGICVGPSRAYYFLLFVLPRRHGLVDYGIGAGASCGELCGCRRHVLRRSALLPAVQRCSRRGGALSASRQRLGDPAARIGRTTTAGDRDRCCASVWPCSTLARGRAGSASTLCSVRDVSVTLCNTVCR